MRFEVISIKDLSPEIEGLWRTLQAADDNLVSPFYAPEFSQAVAHVQDDISVGVVEDDARISGLLPFHRRPGGRGVPPGANLNDYQGFIGAPPDDVPASALLKGFGLAAYDYNHGLSGQTLLRAEAFSHSQSPRADLRKGYDRWEEDVASKSKAIKTLARKERKMIRELGPLRFEMNDPSPKAWVDFANWKDASLRSQGSEGFLVQQWHAHLIDHLRSLKTGHLQGRFSTLYAGDRLVAGHFGLSSDRALHWWFPTFDPSLDNFSAGLILMRHCIQAAASEGLAEVDFGRGTQRYKNEFSNRARDLCEGSFERVGRPIGSLRRIRKVLQRQAFKSLPERHAKYLLRAGSRLLQAGRL